MTEINYFEIFALPVNFEIDYANLETKYLKLQLEHHPDRNIGKEDSIIDSAIINNAYNTLKSDIERAKHILKLQSIAHEAKVDFEFLEVVLELQEQDETPETLRQVAQIKGDLMLEIKSSFINRDYTGASLAIAKHDMLKRL